MDFQGARDYIINRLQAELKPWLFYHSAHHTLDVWQSAIRLAMAERVTEKKRTLIETAALFHDAGMLDRYHDHENASVDLLRRVLPGFQYTENEIDDVAMLVLATRLPQKASDMATRILCDADLDYLGRDDYFIQSFQLRLEWSRCGILDTSLQEWMDIQERFMQDHHYFTESARNLRDQKKAENLREILSLIHRL